MSHGPSRFWVDPIRYAWERCHRIPMPRELDNFVFDLRRLGTLRNRPR